MVGRLLLVASGLGVGWAAGACTRCEVDCRALGPVQVVEAEVRSTDAGIVHLRAEGGERLDIRVFGGSPDDLEVGESYRFPLFPDQPDPAVAATTTAPGLPPVVADVLDEPAADAAAVEPAAFFPDDCDCTEAYITDLDGEVVDPGVDIPFRRYALSFLALSMVGTVGWALARWQKGEPI